VRRVRISKAPLERIGISPARERFDSLEPPLIMGIVNVTPDSFSDGGLHYGTDEAVEHALSLVEQGADMIDVGGESTRPFAREVSVEEEKARVIPVIDRLRDMVEVPISIDTRHVEVAREAVEAGASIINDVNALRGPGMDEFAAESGCSVVVMHMKGTPGNMQVSPVYDDVVEEVLTFLSERVDHLTGMGVERELIMIDPGIGFGKRVSDNLRLLRELHRFRETGCPVLVGASRKSFIGKVLDLDVSQRLEGSIASAVIAYVNGASVLRVHDVEETRRALDIARAVVEAPTRWDD